MHVAREGYGTKNQTFIIDGSGVYVTRNQANYHAGRFELSGNVCSRNGINGLVSHKTDRTHIFSNVLMDNGQVSKEAPALRQAYAGLTLNHAHNVTMYNNTVSTQTRYSSLDSAYVVGSSDFDLGQRGANGVNYICNGKVADSDNLLTIITLAGCPETLAPTAFSTPAPTPYTCITIVDGESSTLEFGKLGANGVTGALEVPADDYNLVTLAEALSALPLIDSDGAEHSFEVTYDESAHDLTFDVGDANGGWCVVSDASRALRRCF